MTRPPPLGQRAVVIGASVAGLATARVLAGFFEDVVILERDPPDALGVPSARRSVPQGRHIHALLASGYRAAASLYPDFPQRLAQTGAITYRVGVDTAYYFPDGHAYTLFGKWRTPCDTKIEVYSQSRALIEDVLRRATLADGAVRIVAGANVSGLVAPGRSVRAVRYAPVDARPETANAAPCTLEADLVVDAAGRRSMTSRWLGELGLRPPPATSLGVKIGYASARMRLPRADAQAARSYLVVSPEHPKGGVMQAIEDGTWIVSLGARLGPAPPTDRTSFREFARCLHSPRIAELLDDGEWLEDIAPFQFPASTWLHYERVPAFPAGLLAAGDSLCSFNPLWGQGMSVALLQALALKDCLSAYRASGNGESWRDRLAKDFFGAAARVIDMPWTMAANQDLSYPQTQGVRPRWHALGRRYAAALDKLAQDDPDLTRTLYEVYHLLTPPAALTAPRLAARALWRMGSEALGGG